jgi:hypothetical protein
MIYSYILGLLPIILVFLMVGIFAGRIAKKYGKSPWLFGGVTVVLITFASWQHIPRWAGWMFGLQMALIHSVASQVQAIATEPRDPNMIDQFTLATEEHLYIFGLSAMYHAKQELPGLITFRCKYPAMEATQQDRSSEETISIQILTDTGHINRPQFFLNQVAADTTRTTFDNKLLDRLVGKQGSYDVFQRQRKATNKMVTTFVFTAKDGQLVLVEPLVFGYFISRNISHDIAIGYNIFPKKIGNDFIKIDETVSGFIKTHLQSQPVNKETTR